MWSNLAFFTPLEDRLPMPGWYLPSFLLIGALSTFPSLRYRTLRSIVGGILISALFLRSPKYTSGNVNPDFVAGLFLSGITLKFWEFVIYRRSEQEVWRVPSMNPQLVTESAPANGNNANGSTNGKAAAKVNGESKRSDEPKVPRKFNTVWEKARWSISLWTTTRGVEWNWGIRDLMPTAPENLTRLNYCRHSIYKLLYCMLAIDYARAIVAWTDFGKPETLPNVSLFTEPFFPRMVVSWLVGLEVYNGLQIPYYFFATITTALGICRPEQWPPIFGNFRKNAYRVRSFWGKCWHQQIRRSITSPAKAIVEVLGLQKGTNLYKYTDLYLSFFFSSLCHWFASYMCSRSEAGMFRLWMSQAAIITLEDFVIAYAQRLGVKDSPYTRGLGFIWVIFWMSLYPSLPTGSGVALHVGSAYDEPPDFSPSMFFPLRKSSNTLLKVVMDYGVSWFCLQRGLRLINARSVDDVITAVQGIVGGVALYLVH